MEHAAKTTGVLAQAGLPPFELGGDGYPLPGKVIKYYREHMTYTDRDGKTRHWTQAELAERLGLKEVMVNLMENRNQGLDSMERRRTLATILRIPPALLGLGSLDQMVEILTGPDSTVPKQGNGKRSRPGKETIQQYQESLNIYSRLYGNGLSYTTVHELEKWITRIAQDATIINIEYKNALLHVLWDYELLCASVYGSDLHQYDKAFEHIDNALEIATILEDRDLQAASFYMRSVYHLRQGRIGLAKVDIEGASLYAKGALLQTKGAIHSQNALIHAKTRTPLDVTLTQKIFDEAEKYTDAQSENATIKFGKGVYFLNRASTLINIGRPTKALELLDDAEKLIVPKRYLVFLDVLRAKCYITQKKPEYDLAITVLKEAIEDSKELKVARNIDHIGKVYSRLLESPYHNSPDVVDLGFMLRELKRTT
ncbi:MAG TPA: helix-turn-helix transcriptional regulator [Ktedonobacteraceae bacterium]|nr:helix-turn-helix transcriptional regulator [Ktedonobacteraceae bacterium]